MCGSHRRRYDRPVDRTPRQTTVITEAGLDLGTDLSVGAELRAGDAERERVGSVLGEAMARGHLSPEEFDQRTDQALRARTRGQLRSLLADLPTSLAASASTGQRLDRRDGAATSGPALLRRWAGLDPAARAHTLGYLTMVLVVLAIWVATAIAVGPSSFWPIWPILGAGLGLAGHLRAGGRCASASVTGR